MAPALPETEDSPAAHVKALALAAGFDAARITTPAPPGHGEQARAWLQAGMHGEMGYLQRRATLREGPANVPELLAGAQSLVVVALSYDFESPALTPGSPSPHHPLLGYPLRATPSPALTPVPSPNSGRGEKSSVSSSASRQGAAEEVSGTPLPELGEAGTREAGGGVRAEKPGPRGIVARYARGADYHNLMWEKLNALGDAIRTAFGADIRTRGFADSGPVRERELAARAGLGWQGKHTNLISLDLGNWFFLGALLTTLPLMPDPPVADHCGTCTRCLAACPTGALVAPQTLDARRCISYLTIELRGPIPRALRPLVGDRIFGCDDCLAACPWNARAQKGREMRLAAREDTACPDLLAWLALLADEAAFRARFADTPLLRPRREGLRRNVCVALGNVGDERAVGGLAGALASDPAPIVRGHAAWALGQIAARTGSAAAREVLEQAATCEVNLDVLAEIGDAQREAAGSEADGGV